MESLNNISQKVPGKVKAIYGSIEFANSLALILFTTFGMYYLTTVAGVSPGIAGSIIAVGSLANAIFGPIMGVISDGCKSKYGRRKPFLLAAAVPFGLTTWLLFTDFGFEGMANVIYYFVMVVLFYAALAMLDVPYTSLGAEVTKDYDERSSLNSWRSFFCMVASIIAGAFPISIAVAIGAGMGSEAKGWSITALLFGVVCTLVILLGWKMTRGYETYREDNEQTKLKDSLVAFKNKSFLYVMAIYSLGLGAYAVGLTVQVYYLTDFVGCNETETTINMLIYNVAALAWIPAINMVSQKFSKKVAWVTFFGIWLAVLIVTFFFVDPGEIVFTYILSVFAGAGGMIGYTVGWSMLPDCIEVDELKRGKRREGMYYGILTIVQKGSAALITFITGIALEVIGYDETLAVQAADTALGIRSLYVWGAGVCIILSFVFVKVYPLTRERHAKLLAAIEAKRKGEEPDLTDLEKLL